MSALCARTKPPLRNLGVSCAPVPAEGARNPRKEILGVSCAFRVPAPVLFQYCFNAVSILFQYCFNTVSILFQYCFNAVSYYF